MTAAIFEYNRQQDLKTWEPIPNMYLEPELIQYFDNKIKIDGVDISYLLDLLNEAYNTYKETDIYVKYLKYVVLLHMRHIIEYIESKGIVLGDVKWNIKQILNEIITNQVDEDYYLNTIDIYEGISGLGDSTDIYGLIDQAIRLDSRRMLYYLIFKEDEDMVERLSEVIKRY